MPKHCWRRVRRWEKRSGDYLEEQFENVSQIKKQAYPTIGSLYQEMDNRQETLFWPYVTVKDEKTGGGAVLCVEAWDAGRHG